ncbi:MAG: hypothetical protein IPL28_25375 [Chloroflexi bacterium]|nr:hypothetical protein [Chloroflexota bacterium]
MNKSAFFMAKMQRYKERKGSRETLRSLRLGDFALKESSTTPFVQVKNLAMSLLKKG